MSLDTTVLIVAQWDYPINDQQVWRAGVFDSMDEAQEAWDNAVDRGEVLNGVPLCFIINHVSEGGITTELEPWP